MTKQNLLENLELRNIKNNLVNIALIVSAFAGFPLLITSLLRIFYYDFIIYWLFHILVYSVILFITLFRKRISYFIKAHALVLAMLSLMFIDFLETGFSGSCYTWLTAAGITASLFFNLRKTVYYLIFSTALIFCIYFFYKIGYIDFKFYGQSYYFPLISVVINTLLVVVVVLIISFAFQYIHKHLVQNIQKLNNQKENLENTAKKLKNEIEERIRSELKVINSEKNFRNIFEQSSEAIVIVDLNYKILDFNDKFLQQTGIDEKLLFEKKIDEILPIRFKKLVNEYFKYPELIPQRFDIEFEKSSGEIVIFDCSTSIISYNEENAFLFLFRDISEKINAEKANYLIAIKAEERERSRFSKELHDGLGPLLSTLKIYLEMFFSNPTDNEVKGRIKNTLSDSIKTVKEISNNLSPYILENMGLKKAVESFVENVRFSQKISIVFNSNLDYRLKQEIEISIFRIITELINNTLKHAKATVIEITININEKTLFIHYVDNGIGFNYDKVYSQKKGIGLLNLKSRIENLGGILKIITSQGKGFEMIAYLKTE